MRLPLRDDLYRSADRETKIAVRAPLVDRYLGESVRILVPKGHAWRPIAEGPQSFQYSTCRGKPSVARQYGRPQPSHGIAEMVDVDDLTEVVRPVRKRAVAKYLAGLEAETRYENGQQAPFAQVDHANQFPLARSELSFCNKANIARGPSPLFDLYQREPFARAVSVADPPFAQ